MKRAERKKETEETGRIRLKSGQERSISQKTIFL